MFDFLVKYLYDLLLDCKVEKNLSSTNFPKCNIKQLSVKDGILGSIEPCNQMVI